MIILNQKRDELVNFDNIMNICITNCDEDGYGIFAGCIVGVDDNYRELGFYKTKKRAKEILQEIIKKINSQKFLLKPQAKLEKETIESAKRYYESLNDIDLIVEDCFFEIKPIGNSNIVIYEMPKE